MVDPNIARLITDFLAEYAHAIDDDDVERWPDFFTKDGFYQITTRENYEADLPIGIMQCQGQGMMKDRMRALREANIYEPHTFNHLLGPSAIEEDNDGRYRMRTNVQIVRTMQNGEMSIFAAGKYIDTIVFEDHAPKFADRRVVLESRRVDILIVYPL